MLDAFVVIICTGIILFLKFSQEIPVKQMKSHVVEAHKMQGYKYQCDVCTKRFEVKSAIRKHYRHDDTENMTLDIYSWF